MAAIGSAVGLGNVWRFPYTCYDNGGGVFLIVFLIALFTAGIPLLILEFSIGSWSHKPPPGAFKKINKKFEWFGWWANLMPFIVAIYYVVVLAWCFSYLIYSFDIRWGANAEGFFMDNFLGLTSSPEILGGIRVPVLIGLIVIWTLVFLILYKGVGRIGKVVLITVPIPWMLLILLTIRGITLPGAIEGISYYLTPNFSKLADVNVWLAAYAQVFFSLGVAQGIMITYASYLKKKSDISNNAFIIAFADTGTSFLAGFAVFSVVGYLAFKKGVGIDSLGISGPPLTFITYPTAISLFPVAVVLFGIMFYIALLTFGLDSAFSMSEPMVASLNSKWKITKTQATAFICIIGFFSSLLFATGGGLYWLSILDHFVANFGLVFIGLIECLIIGWFFNISKLRKYANESSDIMIGKWWDILIKYVVPIILILLLIFSILQNIQNPPFEYATWVIILGGVVPLVLIFLLSFVFMKRRGEKGD
jgi:NSS family neurotransmitter:Na+ symporter